MALAAGHDVYLACLIDAAAAAAAVYRPMAFSAHAYIAGDTTALPTCPGPWHVSCTGSYYIADTSESAL